ncbi:MAG TPA: DUF4159 domain-containing protein [Phycisphaerae bacterium]|nr:DUF4159 domain-containing protein [Phycisphaerae bacterium]
MTAITAACIRSTRLGWLLLPAVTLLAIPAIVFAQEVTGQQVLRAVEAGKQYLLANQRSSGAWPELSGYDGGSTALATLALLNAGLPPNDPRMQAALHVVQSIPLQRTYVVSLKAQALAAADPKTYREQIRTAADWLVQAQRSNGMWGYLLKGEQADFSNTQFALLGLHEAANAGSPVPSTVWRKAENAYRQNQRSDGGFTYTTAGRSATGSMTAAAVASLYVTGNSLAVRMPPGSAQSGLPCCGRYGTYGPIARGLNWLGRQFSIEQNPGSGGWYYYYLYSLERAGILSGLQYIGRHDWYREGAARLVARQDGNGAWRDINSVIDTSFALLFLSKGHRPILVQKLRWSNDNRWNTARNDLAHLAAFIGKRIGDKPVTWNTVDVDADLSAWLAGPILYISGLEFPRLKSEHADRIRRYIDAGGTVLVEATCGRAETAAGFSQFCRDTFPEHELLRLGSEHPVFSTAYSLDGRTVELHGLDIGCRTSVFFSPADLACQWEYGDTTGRNRTAFELGANIAVYATGAEPLPDKLAPPRLAAEPPAGRPFEVPRGALYLAVLNHGGGWRPFPRAIPNLADRLSRDLGVDVVPQYEGLTATDPRLAGHPIVYMTGARSFTLSPEETTALHQHLLRGGTLWADACCGQRLFDLSFREMLARMFPETPLERLSPDHPIVAGTPGFPMPEVDYLPTVRREQPDLNQVWLEGITLEGRTLVVYSPFGLGCGLADSSCFACRGLEAPDALKLAANILLYALSH